MKLALLSLALLASLDCYGAGELVTNFTYEGANVPICLTPTPDGGFVTVFDGYASKYDSNGRRDPRFQSALDTNTFKPPAFLFPDGEGNYFIGPYVTYQNHFLYGMAKLGPTGAWVADFQSVIVTGSSQDEDVGGYIYAICADGAGGCFIGGTFTSLNQVPCPGVAHVDRHGTVTPWQNPADRAFYGVTFLALINPSTLLVVSDKQAYFLSQNGDVLDLETPNRGKWQAVRGGAADPRFGIALAVSFLTGDFILKGDDRVYVWDYQGRLKRSFTQSIVSSQPMRSLTWDEQGRLLGCEKIAATADENPVLLEGPKRLLPDGSYDPAWSHTLSFNILTTKLAVLKSGNILVAGTFTKVNGLDLSKVVKVTGNDPGALDREQYAVSITQPVSQTADIGTTVTFSAGLTGVAPLSFLWYKDGVVLNGVAGFSGAATSTLQVSPVSKSSAGNYLCVITTAQGTVTTSAASLDLAPVALLCNLSVRTTLATGQKLISGFVSTGFKPILLRVAGPALTALDASLSGIADPQLEVYNATSVLVGQNDNWAASLSTTFSQLGAFPFAVDSKDSAAVVHPGGPGSAFAFGPSSGTVLMELYDAQPNDYSNRLINVSARNKVGTGADALIAGFVISGTGTKQLLLRGIGPKLSSYGVSGVLADPFLQLYDNTSGTVIASNDDWAPSLATTFAQVGAFSLDSGSKDAAMLVNLPAGVYSIKLTGVNNGTGEGLVEVYEVWP